MSCDVSRFAPLKNFREVVIYMQAYSYKYF